VVIAVISLVLAGVAYWRAGGKRDIESARAKLAEELEHLRLKQGELTEAFLLAIEEAYADSRQVLHQTAEGLRHLKEEAVEGLEQQVERTMRQLAALEQRLAESAKSAHASTLATARSVELAIRRRVHRLEARGSLLYAKADVVLAIRWARKEEFQRAEKR